MWNEPSKAMLSAIPQLYSTEHIPLADKEIHLHFFMGNSDWFVAEYDGTDIFFGYVILNGDIQNAEWGYFSYEELKSLKAFGSIENNTVACIEVDSDLYWIPKTARNIPLLRG